MKNNKNLLVIASDIGKTAPGIVYKTILNQLAEEYNITLIAPIIYKEGLSSKIGIVPSCKILVLRNAIEKLMIQILGMNIIQKKWAKKQIRYISSDIITKADIIVSFISFHHYGSLMLGADIAARFTKKHIVYSVDAIPAPMGWVDSPLYYQRTKKLLNKYMPYVDAFYSSNEQMLDYQMTLFTNFDKYRGVLYTPIRDNILSKTELNITSSPLFLYTGGLYGPRKFDAVIEGFELFIKKYPNAILRFVGSGPKSKFKKYSYLIESGNIEVCSYSSNLLEHYNQATALVDINAYFDNDVFLSSKIINYLPIKKPIISVTGNNSPSRNVFKDDSSIIHSHHSPLEICAALELSISTDTIGEERERYIEKFSVDNCLMNFKCCISNLININI